MKLRWFQIPNAPHFNNLNCFLPPSVCSEDKWPRRAFPQRSSGEAFLTLFVIVCSCEESLLPICHIQGSSISLFFIIACRSEVKLAGKECLCTLIVEGEKLQLLDPIVFCYLLWKGLDTILSSNETETAQYWFLVLQKHLRDFSHLDSRNIFRLSNSAKVKVDAVIVCKCLHRWQRKKEKNLPVLQKVFKLSLNEFSNFPCKWNQSSFFLLFVLSHFVKKKKLCVPQKWLMIC